MARLALVIIKLMMITHSMTMLLLPAKQANAAQDDTARWKLVIVQDPRFQEFNDLSFVHEQIVNKLTSQINSPYYDIYSLEYIGLPDCSYEDCSGLNKLQIRNAVMSSPNEVNLALYYRINIRKEQGPALIAYNLKIYGQLLDIDTGRFYDDFEVDGSFTDLYRNCKGQCFFEWLAGKSNLLAQDLGYVLAEKFDHWQANPDVPQPQKRRLNQRAKVPSQTASTPSSNAPVATVVDTAPSKQSLPKTPAKKAKTFTSLDLPILGKHFALKNLLLEGFNKKGDWAFSNENEVKSKLFRRTYLVDVKSDNRLWVPSKTFNNKSSDVYAELTTKRFQGSEQFKNGIAWQYTDNANFHAFFVQQNQVKLARWNGGGWNQTQAFALPSNNTDDPESYTLGILIYNGTASFYVNAKHVTTQPITKNFTLKQVGLMAHGRGAATFDNVIVQSIK